MRKIGIIAALLVCCGDASAQLADGLYAAFDTSMGSFTCRLDYTEAPVTCANFAGLAEGSQHWVAPTTGSIRSDPFYNDLIFHRVITNFMIQGGCPLGNGTSGPGYAFPDEFNPNLTHSGPGILSMANSGPDSNGSQFFITLKNTDWLDHKHAVFGEVVDEMNAVSTISEVATDPGDRPLTEVSIEQINILRIGTGAENFDPLAQPIPEVTPFPLAITRTAELEVSAIGITNQCEIQIFNSADLSDWTNLSEKYFPTAVASWKQPASTNRSSEFFKAAQIYYPQAVTAFSDIEGHTLTFTHGSDVIIFSPADGGTGTCSIAGNPYTVSYWEEWTSKPYTGTLVFQPVGTNAFGFDLNFNESCFGYKHIGYWISNGEWTFIKNPLKL